MSKQWELKGSISGDWEITTPEEMARLRRERDLYQAATTALVQALQSIAVIDEQSWPAARKSIARIVGDIERRIKELEAKHD